MFLANRSTVSQGPKCPIMLDVMRPRIFFLNVGWMTAYRGLTKGDTITGGGQHVRDYGSGGEIFNFMPYGGRCYGYGRPANDTIALERLGAPEGSDYVDGILVVWVAKSCVVGWYKNARVYRKWQPSPSGSRRVDQGQDCGFHIMAKKGDCTRLDPDARTMHVPRAKEVEGGMGRYVWYAEGERHERFLRELFDFIKSDANPLAKPPIGKRAGVRGWQMDPRRRKRIEQAAVSEVMRYYGEELGYEIDDRQNDHCGWDLVAKKNGADLYLEVKGSAGAEICAELTANEYKCMKKFRSVYRVCIVTDALSKAPRLSIYGYVIESRQWEHYKDGTPITIEPVSVQIARLHL